MIKAKVDLVSRWTSLWSVKDQFQRFSLLRVILLHLSLLRVELRVLFTRAQV